MEFLHGHIARQHPLAGKDDKLPVGRIAGVFIGAKILGQAVEATPVSINTKNVKAVVEPTRKGNLPSIGGKAWSGVELAHKADSLDTFFKSEWIESVDHGHPRTAGEKSHFIPLGIDGGIDVGRIVPGNPPQFASFKMHLVDFSIALVAQGEQNVFPVGHENRPRIDSRPLGKAVCSFWSLNPKFSN